ncbi:hypothetical protein F3Y22_tig00112383pilonHSYRG00121 [Hibiscus syriacus]|uniref:Uncharacterized protein n=1 Tax=Hibiscus syriacus TaxID=106335 RepID=A0A6A2X0A6_HIBSY|nr:hypothetical protein F3Y22_tig00112383pilonHSYRG00121 [Hibiscus syriacus]
MPGKLLGSPITFLPRTELPGRLSTGTRDESHPSRGRRRKQKKEGKVDGGGLYSLENIKKDYRLKKQRIHAGLWMKEIAKLEEAKLGDSADDIDRLLDSCSESLSLSLSLSCSLFLSYVRINEISWIFDSANADLENSKIPSSSELKNKPDGWETTSKTPDGNVWKMSQREEDILLQEFDRRIAYCKFQIANSIKTHIFSRRRPIDGWKYMIEEIGPNARQGHCFKVTEFIRLFDKTIQGGEVRN